MCWCTGCNTPVCGPCQSLDDCTLPMYTRLCLSPSVSLSLSLLSLSLSPLSLSLSLSPSPPYTDSKWEWVGWSPSLSLPLCNCSGVPLLLLPMSLPPLQSETAHGIGPAACSKIESRVGNNQTQRL